MTHNFSHAKVIYSGGAGSQVNVSSGSAITLKAAANELTFSSGGSTSEVTLKDVPTLGTSSGRYTLNTRSAQGNLELSETSSGITTKFTYVNNKELAFKEVNTISGGSSQSVTCLSATSNTLDSTGTLTVSGSSSQAVELRGFGEIKGSGLNASLTLDDSANFVLTASPESTRGTTDTTYSVGNTATKFSKFSVVTMESGNLSMKFASSSDSAELTQSGYLQHKGTIFIVETGTFTLDGGAGNDTLLLASDTVELAHSGANYSTDDLGNSASFTSFETVTVGTSGAATVSMQLTLSGAADEVTFSETNRLTHEGTTFATKDAASKLTLVVDGGAGNDTLLLASNDVELTHKDSTYSMENSGNSASFTNFESITAGTEGADKVSVKLTLSTQNDALSFSEIAGLKHESTEITTTGTSSEFTVEGSGGGSALTLFSRESEITVDVDVPSSVSSGSWKTTLGQNTLIFKNLGANTDQNLVLNFNDSSGDMIKMGTDRSVNSTIDSSVFRSNAHLTLNGGSGSGDSLVYSSSLALKDIGNATFKESDTPSKLTLINFESIHIGNSSQTLSLTGHANGGNEFTLSGNSLSYVGEDSGPATTFTSKNFSLTGADVLATNKLVISSLNSMDNNTLTVGKINTIDIASVKSGVSTAVHEYNGAKYLSLVWEGNSDTKLTLNLVDAGAKVTDSNSDGNYLDDAQAVYNALTTGGGSSLHIVI